MYAARLDSRNYILSFILLFISILSNLIDLRSGYKCWKFVEYPPATILVVSLLIFIYLVDKLFSRRYCYDLLVYDSRRRHQIWRFLTYAFVHPDWFTLFQHVQIHLLIGRPLEILFQNDFYIGTCITGIVVGAYYIGTSGRDKVSGFWASFSLLFGAFSGVILTRFLKQPTNLRFIHLASNYIFLFSEANTAFHYTVDYTTDGPFFGYFYGHLLTVAALKDKEAAAFANTDVLAINVSIMLYTWYFIFFKLNSSLRALLHTYVDFSTLVLFALFATANLVFPWLEIYEDRTIVAVKMRD